MIIIRLWNIETGECLRILEGHESNVWYVRFNDNYIVSGDFNGYLKTWDLSMALSSHTDDSCVTTLKGHNRGVSCLQFDDSHIVSGDGDLYSSDSGTIIIIIFNS